MVTIQIAALIVIIIFYIAYFSKMLLQHRQGIRTNQIGKGNKPKKILLIETLMKISSYTIIPIEVISIIRKPSDCWIGIVIALLGVFIFIIAMWTMQDSWRAGIPEKDKTTLIKSGIYRWSRNPAFLGFDLMYLGLLISFFNVIHLLFVLYAVIMLHLQILQEEQFLTDSFGEEYTTYKQHTGRYFII